MEGPKGPTNSSPTRPSIGGEPEGSDKFHADTVPILYILCFNFLINETNINPGYLKIKSAFILPHSGSATKDTRIAMANLAIDNIDEFFKTGKCKNKVN